MDFWLKGWRKALHKDRGPKCDLYLSIGPAVTYEMDPSHLRGNLYRLILTGDGAISCDVFECSLVINNIIKLLQI